MSDTLTFIQGDTGPNPVFHLKLNSPTAGATARDLASVASAYVRWQPVASALPVTIIPATIGPSPGLGFLEAFMASVQPTALATGGRFEVQVVLRGPWGVETWPRDTPFPVTVIDRNGAL